MRFEEWEWTSNEGCAEYFAENPDEIRSMLDMILRYADDAQYDHFIREIEIATERHGLDPIWIDYVKAHMEGE